MHFGHVKLLDSVVDTPKLSLVIQIVEYVEWTTTCNKIPKNNAVILMSLMLPKCMVDTSVGEV